MMGIIVRNLSSSGLSNVRLGSLNKANIFKYNLPEVHPNNGTMYLVWRDDNNNDYIIYPLKKNFSTSNKYEPMKLVVTGGTHKFISRQEDLEYPFYNVNTTLLDFKSDGFWDGPYTNNLISHNGDDVVFNGVVVTRTENKLYSGNLYHIEFETSRSDLLMGRSLYHLNTSSNFTEGETFYGGQYGLPLLVPNKRYLLLVDLRV